MEQPSNQATIQPKQSSTPNNQWNKQPQKNNQQSPQALTTNIKQQTNKPNDRPTDQTTRQKPTKQRTTNNHFLLRLPFGQCDPVSRFGLVRNIALHPAQVPLLGATPVLQVRQVRKVKHRGGSLAKVRNRHVIRETATTTGAAHRGTRAPPGQVPSYTGQRKAKTKQQGQFL